jgi:hypothetical protein
MGTAGLTETTIFVGFGVDGALYFTSGPGTLKSRNLAGNPACSVSVRLCGIDLVLEEDSDRGSEMMWLS